MRNPSDCSHVFQFNHWRGKTIKGLYSLEKKNKQQQMNIVLNEDTVITIKRAL